MTPVAVVAILSAILAGLSIMRRRSVRAEERIKQAHDVWADYRDDAERVSGDTGSEAAPHWQWEPSISEGTYRWRPRVGRGSSDRWDPFSPEQEQKARILAARRRRPTPGVPDYYALLGVPPDATDNEIERSYRKRVAEHHPDRYFDDPERRRVAEEYLRALNAAMQTLRDPLRRARYDASR